MGKYLTNKNILSFLSAGLPSELIITDSALMHEVNISPSFSLARFFLTHQLIYKSKIGKHNVILEVFVSDISIARNLHLPGFEKEHFSYIRTHTPLFFGSNFGICVAENQGMFEDQGLILEVKKYLQNQ